MFLRNIFVVMLITTLTANASARASYGEACSKEMRCDSRNFLTCSSSGVCDCFMRDSMVYDESLGKCVTLAGERCLFTTMEGERSWSDDLPCISGANCTAGTCECISTHFEVSNGTCSRKKGYGADCTGDQMCDSAEYLSCGNDNKCACDTKSGLVLEGSQCRLLAGKTCSADTGAGCISGATCDSLQCKCDQDRYPVNGTCLPKGTKGDTCTANIECLETTRNAPNTPTFLVCRDGACQCDPVNSMDEEVNGVSMCKRQLDQVCTVNDCIEGAFCTGGTCTCSERTHFKTKNNTCQVRASHGGQCTGRDKECLDSLQCGTSQTCVCASGTSFSVPSNKCVVSAGYICQTASRRQYNSMGYYYGNRDPEYSWSSEQECVPNARCGDDSEFETRTRRCTCPSSNQFYTSSNGDGLCYVNADGSCDGDTFGSYTSRRCLPGLVCTDGTCQCMFTKHQFYVSNEQKCQTRVGGPCNATSECGNAGTECSGEPGFKSCTCKQGFIQVDRECRVAFGGKCKFGSSKDDEKCDSTVGGLQCTAKGTCECPKFQEYSQTEASCKGLVGARCSLETGKEDFCAAGSFCKPFRGSTAFGLCSCQAQYKRDSNRKCVPEKKETAPMLLLPEVSTTESYFHMDW